MSVHVISWVLKQSPAEGSDRLVLIVLADHADADGSNAYPAVETIAAEARCSRRTAQAALRRLEDAGAIERAPIKGPRGQHRYTVLMGGANTAPRADHDAKGRRSRRGGAQSTPEGGAEISPEPSTEPLEGTVKEPADARTREAAFRFCRWLSEQADEEPRSSYPASQLDAAAWLLDHVEKGELRAAVEWAVTRTYWATRARTAGKLRQAWRELRVEWRAATGRNGGQARRSVGRSGDDLRRRAAELRNEGR